jgi:hypothetical protein
MTRRLTRCGLVLVGALIASTAMAQIPRTIAYQGILTNPGGNPLPNGNHTLVVKLYDQETGGTALFSETHTDAVIKGVF